MTSLIRAELLKLRTTRDLWWTAGVTLLLVGLAVSLTITGPPTDTPLDSGPGVRSVVAAASTGSLMLLLLGITCMAGEFRHGTATTTFLADPQRRRTFAAKLSATMLAGAAIAFAASVVTLAVALPWLAAKDVGLAGRVDDMAVALIGSIAATSLAGAIGVGLGAILRNQSTAVVVALVWAVVVEAIVAGFVPELFRWLPGGAFAAVTGSATVGETFGLGGGLTLSLGYAGAFALAGRGLLLRRDLV